MRPLGSLGIGLSLVFGFLVLALVAEVYYLLWWKRRIAHRDVERGCTSPSSRELLCLFCWKKPSSLSSTGLNPQEICSSLSSMRISSGTNDGQLLHLHSNPSSDLLVKPFDGEDGIEAELMRLHNLSGPPKLLFTIKEETKEDLESQDGKSQGRSRKGSRGRSLSDVLLPVETPFFTPLSSPPFFTPPLTPLDCYSQQGFNPLFESSKEDDSTGIKRSSPPPKFKFLKDAEEKLYRKTLMEEAIKAAHKIGASVEDGAKSSSSATISPHMGLEQDEGSFITLMIGKNREKDHQHQHQHHSSASASQS